jgi:hypothetical protein
MPIWSRMPNTTDETSFEWIGTGLLGRILSRSGLLMPGTRILLARCLIGYGLTWIPLLILSIAQGLAFNRDLKIPFLYDFGAHVRFLLALPVFLLTDRILAPRAKETINELLENNIIGQSQLKRHFSNIRRFQKRVNSIIFELIFLVLVITAAVYGVQHRAPRPVTNWQYAAADSKALSAAGWWFFYVAVPIWQFMLLRWFWQVLIYCNFLLNTAKLNLKLIPTHPDEMAGLRFLSIGQIWLLPFVFALSAVFSSSLGGKIVFEGADFLKFKYDIAAFVVVACLFIIGPLVVFTPKLLKAKRTGMLEYGTIASRYVEAFERKWLLGENPQNEQFLGSADIQSLADLAGSYQVIKRMRPVPFDLPFVIKVLATIIMPILPLLLSVYAVDELFKVLKGLVF